MQMKQLALITAFMLAHVYGAPTPTNAAPRHQGAKPDLGDDSVWALISDKRDNKKPEAGDDSVWALISDKRDSKKPEAGDDSVWALIS
ncbi:hypothetical protein BKA66DRAFT_450361, partial [Pyrenochaeta sp. MPI-SDFR-AT-0127]